MKGNIMSKQCPAHLANGQQCSMRISDDKKGCFNHPEGKGAGDLQKSKQVPHKQTNSSDILSEIQNTSGASQTLSYSDINTDPALIDEYPQLDRLTQYEKEIRSAEAGKFRWNTDLEMSRSKEGDHEIVHNPIVRTTGEVAHFDPSGKRNPVWVQQEGKYDGDRVSYDDLEEMQKYGTNDTLKNAYLSQSGMVGSKLIEKKVFLNKLKDNDEYGDATASYTSEDGITLTIAKKNPLYKNDKSIPELTTARLSVPVTMNGTTRNVNVDIDKNGNYSFPSDFDEITKNGGGIVEQEAFEEVLRNGDGSLQKQLDFAQRIVNPNYQPEPEPRSGLLGRWDRFQQRRRRKKIKIGNSVMSGTSQYENKQQQLQALQNHLKSKNSDPNSPFARN